mmetsp:Transcript_85644/g.256566  ORF Transcript_85644/g.256566 Transcript_85644/m.256566 type:complete len:259 (-) Transcript_85644:1014-1790(-)
MRWRAVSNTRLLQHRPHERRVHRLRGHKGVDAGEPQRRSERVGEHSALCARLAAAMCLLRNRSVPHRSHVGPVCRDLCQEGHRAFRRPALGDNFPRLAAQQKGEQLLLPQHDDLWLVALRRGRRVVLVRLAPLATRAHVEAFAVGLAILALLASAHDQDVRLLLRKCRQRARPAALHEERQITMRILVSAPIQREHHARECDREPVERSGLHLLAPSVLLQRQLQQRSAQLQLVARRRPRPHQIRVAACGRPGLQLCE